ncbi:MAG: hypothetical protein SAK29_40230 [Scytonema sp. PMC 1069.18]|nr:hypothetical protein [Scytonema sp. PMC 1069.18]MEC4882627.1 hypothetical protein [Scytonema sp. PMC 1070.18]
MSKIYENPPKQNLDKILVSELASKYGIAKSTVYNKLRKLYIKPFTGEDGKKYITSDELKLLDELNTFLKEKRGSTQDFVQLCVKAQKIIPPQGTAIHLASEQSIPEEIPQQSQKTEAIVIVEQASQGQMIAVPEQFNLVEDELVEISERARQLGAIAYLQLQKVLQTQAEDIQERARNRAFVNTLKEESLVVMYEITEDFTPEQKQQLEKHRAECDRARKARDAAHNVNTFLSQALRGLIIPPNLKTNPSPSPNGGFTNA